MDTRFPRPVLIVVMLACASCSSIEKKREMNADVTTDLKAYEIRNKNGVSAQVINFGGRIVSLKVPDANGGMTDVVLGFDSLHQYTEPNPYFGSLIGRYGNRIARGRFQLEGVNYQLATNNGANSLHGGPGGFHNVFWKVTVANDHKIALHYQSDDGEEGYPGRLDVAVTYELTDDNALRIDYSAFTDKTTIVNLTQHSYFNLAGTGDILNHQVVIHADRYTPVDSTLIPTGEVRPVAGTPFDFRQPHAIGERIQSDDQQIKFGKGYDHNWVLNKKPGESEPTLAARVSDPDSGRVMEVWTTEPGLQFYSGNFLDGSLTGKGGKPARYRSGFCMETQHFPDSPNHPEFPTVILNPGEQYRQTTIYKFLLR